VTTFWIEFSGSDGTLIGVAIVDADDNASDIMVVDITIAGGFAPRSASIVVRKLRLDANIPASQKNRLLSETEVNAFLGGGKPN
jgi:hypothetical protein